MLLKIRYMDKFHTQNYYNRGNIFKTEIYHINLISKIYSALYIKCK